MTRDLNIWRELPAAANGYIPAVPRRWQFVGLSQGKRCNFPVELLARHPSLPDRYSCRAVFAHNCWFTPDWVRLDQLQPV